MSRVKLINRMKSLDDIDGVTVEMDDEKRFIKVRYRTERSLDFYFKWVDDSHFVGYFADNEGETSSPVISLWTPMDAIHFSAVYSLLIQLRVGRPGPDN